MTSQSMSEEQAIVTQADRDAAANLMADLFTGVDGFESDLGWRETVRRGEDDAYPIVQAFARHRTTALRSQSVDRAKLVEEAYKALRDYRMTNMSQADDRFSGYPLVDLCSRPAPFDIRDGEEQIGEMAFGVVEALLPILTTFQSTAIKGREAVRDGRVMQFEALLDDVPPSWRETGYRTEVEEIADMANVGRSLMERITEVVGASGPMYGWAPADDPAEIVIDMANMLHDATPPEGASPALGWRDIATAPEDGEVLGYCQGIRMPFGIVKLRNGKPFVMGAQFAFDLPPITHWMPLPAPPSKSPSSEGGL